MGYFNYEVFEVRHEDGDHSKIIRYKAKDLSGGWLSSKVVEFDRSDMFIKLGAGIKFGVRENSADEDLITVITKYIGGHWYIKTIGNDIPEDNLGSLPEF